MPRDNNTNTSHSPFAFVAGVALGAAVAYFVGRNTTAQVNARHGSRERNFQATDPTCSICREDIYVTLEKYLSCGHVFHKICIQEWSRRSRTCPICKARF